MLKSFVRFRPFLRWSTQEHHHMNEEQRKLLDLPRTPARLSSEQVALLLNFATHDIPVLVRAKLLRPLGNPRKCSVKYFAAVDIIRLAQDAAWLGKATNAIYSH